ncbi:MAG: carbamoyl-phosphate synthase domain-containing protein, partial [Archaeoglobaceae archaeon]
MKAALALEDGTYVEGEAFGAEKIALGEIVFCTSMTGYTEALTDPSYKGQILMMTYPLIGNYGVCREDFESDGVKVEGFVVRELCKKPSNWRSEMSVDELLKSYDVVGIEGVDTRM